MERLQRPHVIPVGQDACFFHLRKIANLNFIRRRLGQDGAAERRTRFSCSWKKVGNKKKFPMPKSEAIAPFRQAAFADDHASAVLRPARRRRAPIP